jgi:hypothetical protein
MNYISRCPAMKQIFQLLVAEDLQRGRIVASWMESHNPGNSLVSQGCPGKIIVWTLHPKESCGGA